MTTPSPAIPAPAAPDAPPLVEASGIVKRYGPTVALQDGRLTVRAGESHALVGRNGAGKSTLVSLLTGLQAPDAGRIAFDGEPAPPLADRDAWRRKVACVYQKPTVVPGLTVAENLFINRQPRGRGGLISWRRLRAEAADVLRTWDVRVDPEARTADLKVEDRQLVEIARALGLGARFIVLDEPTAQLDKREIERLFTRMRALQESGVTFLFISHHLQEVYEVCQTVTVLRDARWITTAPVAALPRAALVEAMAGEAPTGGATPAGAGVPATAPVLLDVRGLTSPSYDGVDLTVRRGEVVGLAGSSGSGKVNLAESFAGLHTPTGGSATLDGAPLPFGDVPAALRAGVGCVPRDRHGEGLVPSLSIGDNATLSVLGRLGRRGFVSADRKRAFAGELIERLDIHAEGPDQPVSDLSGGNAQKVVMARALASEPRLLVLINPTAGVDVKSKESLLARVDRARDDGTAVLVVSDELDDLRRCDRVLVLFHGRVVAEHPAGWHDHELIASIEGVARDQHG
ncbi:sugar ABC transporter ATP-binding protein [Streptomyces spectabilis]|uniref:Simple sugar transport system ATP-binding protein n=1 Tax=Streptomyces spectabilis TaxID=68270 RepID=A0A5P2XI80_STRST|nr:sugar ABC transporter ATP-binding protein [Streptomyces spectabilis]MBB5105328.1 simple sugar transport system ATP-binding protein [Streptomyces spectabilis]MCI3906521.1 sugar ABC transporter ATP-binding protein [Streptomyces spectabilis]QEV63354.1 sugar ABC transporter ATP-binding protein [Streptomyces spectabilis]GGV20985.1 sugar ABC transporter ATP-binding protein [Streptomyces spectabilis]